jgi:hypothetical protein
MAARSLNERVEILEQKVGDLQLLPDRVAAVESQILQLRGEMRDGFSAILGRFETIDQRFVDLERRMQEGDGETRRRMQEGDEETRRQMQESDEETRRFMRMLHEEVLTRFSLLQEGRRKR